MKPTNFLTEWEKIPLNVKKAVIITIIAGLFAHFFVLTNKFINHDDLLQLVSDMDFSTSGRWFLKYPNMISSNFSMPWINRILIILYTAIMSGIIVDLFKIKSNLAIGLFSAWW